MALSSLFTFWTFSLSLADEATEYSLRRGREVIFVVCHLRPNRSIAGGGDESCVISCWRSIDQVPRSRLVMETPSFGMPFDMLTRSLIHHDLEEDVDNPVSIIMDSDAWPLQPKDGGVWYIYPIRFLLQS